MFMEKSKTIPPENKQHRSRNAYCLGYWWPTDRGEKIQAQFTTPWRPIKPDIDFKNPARKEPDNQQ